MPTAVSYSMPCPPCQPFITASLVVSCEQSRGCGGGEVALSVSLNGEEPEQWPLGVPRNPSELGFNDSSRIRPDLWSLETFNPFFPGVEGPFLPKKKSGLSFSKASFGSSGLQDTGNTDEQSFKYSQHGERRLSSHPASSSP